MHLQVRALIESTALEICWRSCLTVVVRCKRVLDRLANLALPSHSVLVLPSPYREVGDHFGDQNVRSTFAEFSLRGEAECVI
jgi:hypothetical protein